MKRKPFIFSLFILLSLFLYSCTFDELSQVIDYALDEELIEETSPTNELLSITYIDVGQGDSAYIQFPNGKTILIDAGESTAFEKITNSIDSSKTTNIDVIVATHPHADHIGSFSSIIKNYSVGKIYMPKATSNSNTFETLLQTIAEHNLKITEAKNGVTIDIDPLVTVEILSPISKEYEDTNNYSIVIKITYEDTSFLFTGDAEILVEEEMVAKNIDLKADVLKVGHHGSNTSTSSAFLRKVRPTYAIISVGVDNSYGHPKQRVLDRLADFGITVYRTDELGSITLTSDGTELIISTISSK